VRVLLVRLGAVGDIVHTIPAATALAAVPGGTEIDWLVERRHRPVLDLFDLPVRAVEIEPSGGPADTSRAIRELRRRRYDAALDFQGLIKSAVLTRLAGARRVIGFVPAALRERMAGLLYTEHVDPGEYGHVIQKNLSLVRALGHMTIPEGVRWPVRTPTSSLGAAMAAGGPYAIINPGAGWPNKRWPPERFGELASRLRRACHLRAIVMWGPGEDTLARTIVDASGEAAELAPATELSDLMAIVRGARLMISGDTGPLHLATAAGVPIVGLFGPTDPKRNGPWSGADVSISRFAGCACHHKRQCTRATWCLDEIGVEEVMTAVFTRLVHSNSQSTHHPSSAIRNPQS
jgi:heptosyltransferase-1